MAKYQSTIEYNIKTNLDATGLQKLQAQLTAVNNVMQQKATPAERMTAEFKSATAAVADLKNMLTSAFNAKLGILDLSKLNAGLQAGKVNIADLNRAFEKAGATGTTAANNLVARLYKMDTGLKSVSKATDKIVNTIGNTFRWGVIASAFASIMNAVHGAAQYTADLDKSLTNIMMVSGESRDNMNEFAQKANEAAQRMGSTTTAMTNATQIFVQQGLSLEESGKLAEYSVHLANVSGQDSAEAADEITAYKNAFKIDLEDIENAISKWAAVANSAAVSVEELSVASQKAASVAKTVGVDMDQFAGHITAIEATTREAPENIGNGLKTLYSRISDIKLGESLEDGVDLGQFTMALHKVGVEALDASGQLRDAGAIIEDLMARWGELSTTEQVATATTVAGRFQLARFEALMNSADIYNNVVGVSRAETGTETYDRMQETFRDSMQGRMNALTASVEEIFSNLFTTDSLYPFIDAAQTLVSALNEVIESIGGGSNAISAFGLIFGQVFNTQIARGINNLVQNRELARKQQSQVAEIENMSLATLTGGGVRIGNARTEDFQRRASSVGQHASIMSEEEFQAFGKNLQEWASSINTAAGALQKANELTTQYGDTLDRAGIFIERDTNLTIEEMDALEAQGKVFKDTVYEMNELARAAQTLETGMQESRESFAKYMQSLQGNALRPNSGMLALSKIAKNNDPTTMKQNKVQATFDMNQSVQSLRELNKQSQFTNPANLEKISKLLKQIDSNALSTNKDVTAFRKSVAELDQSIAQLSKDFEKDQAATKAFADAIQQLQKEFDTANVQANHLGNGVDEMSKRLDQQASIQSITNLTMGIGQLAFAWQSFQALGSIWADVDMEFGEKLLETFINIGFTIPMITMGVGQTIDGFKTLIQETKNFSMTKVLLAAATKLEEAAQRSSTEATTEAVVAEGAEATANTAGAVAATGAAAADGVETVAKEGLAVAAGKATVALGAFIAANAAIIAPIAAIVAALGAVAFAIGQSNQRWEEYKEKVEEDLDASNKLVESITSVKDKYDELYQTYEETGEASDGLKDSALELAETLGIEGAAAKLACGEYKALNEQIQEATNSQLAYNSIKASEQQEVLEKDIGHTAVATGGMTIDPYTGYAVPKYNYLSTEDSISNKAKQFNDLQEQIDETTKKLTEFNKDGSPRYDSSEVDKEIDDLKELQKQYTLTEQEAEWADLQRQKAENTFAQDLNNGIFDDMTNVDQVKNVLDGQSDIFDEYQYILNTKGQEEADAWYAGLLSQIQENLGSGILYNSIESYFNSMSLDNAFDAFSEKASTKINDLIDQSDLFDTDGQYANQWVEVVKQQLDQSGLLDSEKIQFLAGIDWTKSFNEIQQEIEELGSPDRLPKLEFEATLSDRSTFSETKIDDLLKDTNLTESGFNAMAADIFESDGIQAAAKQIEESLANIDPEAENAAEQIANLRKQYENLGKTSKDIAAYNLQMNKGVSNLVKNWKNYAEVLEQDAAKGTSDYYQALGELDEIMSDILNIDTGVLSRDFYENADALDAMARAAEGDVSAIDDLRTLAAEDIILHLDVQGIDETDKEYLINQELLPMLAEVQSVLDNAQLGFTADADVNTQLFIDKLNELLEKGQITAEQASNILSSIGMDAEISEVQSEPVENRTKIRFPRIEVDENGVPKPTGDYIDAEIITESQSSFPQIQGATYTGPGVQTVGASSAGNTGGSGGSKGGGGSSKGKEPSQVSRTNPAETEKDIYNKVNAEMERLQDNYKRITRLRDNSYGSNFRKYSAQEIANLEAQNANLEKRQKITKKYIEALKSNKDNDKLNVKKTDTLGYYGLTDTDNDGIVDNYDSIVDKARAEAKKAQKAADDYFKAHGGAFDSDGNTTTEATMTEEESKHYKKLTETASNAADRVSGITDAVNKYQDAWDDARDTEEQIQENLEAIKQVQIEIFEQALKGIDNLKELNKQAAKMKGFFEAWDGTGKRTLSNSPFRALTSDVAELDGMLDSVDGKASTFFSRMQKQATDDDQKKFWQSLEKQAKENGINGSSIIDLETFALQALLDPNQAKQYFDLDEQAYHDVLTQLKTTIEDDLIETEQTMEDLLDNIIAAYDDINERMEDRLDLYEREQDKLSHILNMTKIIYGDDYDKINEVLQKQIDAINIRASDVNKYIAYWQEQLDNVNEALKLNPNDPALQEQAKHLDATLENYKKQARDLIEEAAELADEKFSNALENAAKKFQDAMLSGNGRSYAWEVERWELAKEAADEYKDSVEKGYEIDKLRAKYQKLLDGSSTLKVQKQIKNSMQEQLAYLENQTNLSQFDVDLANAKLELLQKQIALEEAQRNKNQMRLRRDTQGNYSYVYAANNDDIADKQQEVLDSGYDIYEMSKSEQQRLTDESLRLLQDYTERYKQIAADKTLSDEERAARLEELAAQFKKRMEALNADFDDAIDGMIDGAKILAEYAADDVAEYFDAIANTTKDNWEETMDTVGVAYSDTIRNMATDTTTFEGQVDNFANDINTALDEFDENVTSTAESFGENFDDISDDVQDVIDQMQDLNSETAKFLDLIADDTKKISKAQQKLGDYQATLEGLTETSSALREALDEANKKLKKAEEDTLYWKAKYNEAVKPKSSGSSGSGGGSNSGGNNAAASKPELKPGAYATLKSGHVYHYSSYGDSPTGNYNAGIKDGVVIQGYSGKQIGGSQTAGPYYIALHGSGKNGANTWQLGWVKPEDLEGYDTGGYTGAWGTEGRAALLHEKELVLNKDDTENMLAAIKLVRDMVSIIQTPTLSSAIGGITQALNDTIEQRVEVTAEFPNATDADDIRSAILSLADDAFQYAYSTR